MAMSLELYRRSGRDKRVKRQDALNAELMLALEEIELRARCSDYRTPEADGVMEMSP